MKWVADFIGVDNGRQWSPYVSETQWDDVLSRNGFANTEVVF